MTAFLLLAIPTAVTVHPLPSEAVLEPSVQNEVEHALDRAPEALPPPSPAAASYFRLWETNGLSAAKAAIALVSAQRADGRWFVGTNDVTTAAVLTLRRLAGLEEVPVDERKRRHRASGAIVPSPHAPCLLDQ